ncbi:MAG: PmoA family protein [Pirellulaceae bacterium]
MQLRKIGLLVLVLSFVCVVDSVPAADVQIQQEGNTYIVTVDGQAFAEVDCKTYAKPIVYPILGPDQMPMTRNRPMKEVQGEADDHPHHKSMWFAHGDINGFSFWDEKAIIKNESSTIDSSADVPTVVLKNRLESKDGQLVGTETARISFLAGEGVRMIDWDHTYHASEGELKFGDTKEGMMAIRTHSSLRLKNGRGVTTANGQAVNSNGESGPGIWGKPAKWVDYSGKIDDKLVGIAIFDAPTNHGHPSHWHARDYGLVAANPFGLHDFVGAGHDGTLTLPAGESLHFHYRFVFHQGNAEDAKIAELYEAFAAEPASK